MKTGTERKRADLSLLFLVLLLLVLGLVLLYSTSAYNGRVKFQDPAYYFKKQLFATTLGLLALYLVSQMDYHRIARLAWPIYGASLLLSTLVLFVGAGVQWLQTMAGAGTAVLPAGGICQSGGGDISGTPDQRRAKSGRTVSGLWRGPWPCSCPLWGWWEPTI